MSFTYAGAEIFLDDIATPLEGAAGTPLCSRHADSRTAPVGWTLVDRRRAGDRHLFIPVEEAGAA
jgi:hypothetical protein